MEDFPVFKKTILSLKEDTEDTQDNMTSSRLMRKESMLSRIRTVLLQQRTKVRNKESKTLRLTWRTSGLE